MATLNYNWQLIAEAGGSINGNTCNVRIYAKINSQSMANNNSSVSYQSRLYYSNSYGFSSYDPTTKSISGTGAGSQSANAYGTYGGGETVLQTITGVVGHNASGNANVSMSANFNAGPWGYNVTASGSASLPKINRYSVTNSVTGVDIEEEFSVNYTKYINNYQYKLRISVPNKAELERIDYNTSGEPFRLSQETIERIFYNNPDDKYVKFGTDKDYRIKLGFAVETWNGSQRLYNGNEIVKTCEIRNANPVFTDFDYNDINATTVALTGNSKYNINGYSNIRVTISSQNKAIAQKGATMSKYQLMIGSATPKEVPYSDTEDVSIDLPNASIGEYKVYAIDSRNNSTPVTKLSLKNIDYKPLDLDRQKSYVERDGGGIGENVTLNYQGTMWNDSFGAVSNDVTLSEYYVKLTSQDDTQWVKGTTDITPTKNNENFSFSGFIRNISTNIFNIQDSYDFKIVLQDKLSSSVIQLTPLPSGIPNISLNKNGVGIMCDYDESKGGLLQVGGKIIGESSGGTKLWENSNPSASFSGNITLNSDDYDLLEFYFYKGTDSTKSVHSTKIIKGYDGQISISGTGVFNNVTYNSTIRRNITYNSDTQYNISTALYRYGNSNSYAVSNVLIPIQVIGYKL